MDNLPKLPAKLYSSSTRDSSGPAAQGLHSYAYFLFQYAIYLYFHWKSEKQQGAPKLGTFKPADSLHF